MKTNREISFTSKRSSANSSRSLKARSVRNLISSFPNPNMRRTRYGNNYQYSEPDKTKVDVGETHVTLREPSGRVLVARILERVADANGKITSLLLDRLVHEGYSRI